MTRNSSTLSNVAVSLPPSRTIGSDLLEIVAEDARSGSRASRARIQLMLPRSVLISPLWAMKRYGCASGHDGNVLVLKRWWTSASADSTIGIGQVREHRLDLIGREHALVDERVGRQAREVEVLSRSPSVLLRTACSTRLRIT